MEWAVDQGADVVSMSLGGDTDDGSHPLARAVNELSAISDTPLRHRGRQQRRQRPLHRHRTRLGRRGADRRRRRRPRRDGRLLQPRPALRQRRAQARGRRPRRRRHRRPRRRHRPRPDVDESTRPSAAPPWRPRTWPAWPPSSSRSTRPGTASSSSRPSPTAPCRSPTRPASTPAPAASTPCDAIHQDVLAPASLSLGSYAWPYADLAPDPHVADLHEHRHAVTLTWPSPARTARRSPPAR